MPAVNLSNRLNPNNIHYDRVLAAQYKRMSKPEKEALWAQDRLMQQRAAQSQVLIAFAPRYCACWFRAVCQHACCCHCPLPALAPWSVTPGVSQR